MSAVFQNCYTLLVAKNSLMKYLQMFISDLNYGRHMTAIKNNMVIVAW